MVLFVVVKLKQIFKQQRDYRWPRPERCPRCQECRLWGHGFVLAYFDESAEALYLKRFRCPGCRCVIRLRPKGYFLRFQASIQRIYACLRQRLVEGRLGEGFRDRMLEGFSALLQRGGVLVASNLAF